MEGILENHRQAEVRLAKVFAIEGSVDCSLLFETPDICLVFLFYIHFEDYLHLQLKRMKVMVEALIIGIIMHSQNTLFF